MFQVNLYQNNYEKEWVVLRARIVARSHTWDFVEYTKPKYEHNVIELILLHEQKLIGYLDVELEELPGQICWENTIRGGVVQEFGIAPEYQKQGLSKLLLEEMCVRLKEKNIFRVEFWTKDPNSIKFYQHLGFREIFCHEHYRVSTKEFLTNYKELPFQVQYGYFVKNTKVHQPKAIQKIPLEPHTCYGFELKF